MAAFTHAKTALLLILFLAPRVAGAQSGIYWIGNSHTQDTIPQSIQGGAHYHIDCGVSLTYIYNNPSAPCVGTSTIWPTALAGQQYSWLVLQPFPSETLAECVATIGELIALQPDAKILIHTSWATHANIETEWANPSTATVVRSDTFYSALVGALETAHPTREFVRTDTHAMIHDVLLDCAAETAPFASVEYLYRDPTHMTYGAGDGSNGGLGSDGAGRYLAHNAMRRALGLPYETPSGCTASSEIRAYLRGKIETYHGTPKVDGVIR